MDSINYGMALSQALEGNSCLISRTHCPREMERPENFFTLHRLVYKILKTQPSNHILTEQLSGGLMKYNVKKAIFQVAQQEPDERMVTHYYHLIRDHKNKLAGLKNDPFGMQILSRYQSILSQAMDWEDSFQTAAWLLRNSDITDLYQFSYQNIILVQPHLIYRQNNTNALDFFYSFCEWIENFTKRNVYIVDHQGLVSKYENSKFIFFTKLNEQTITY
ncbi:hypothetical protein [Peribacillus sp. NPDC058075]|uniref:hypothetical protein n=1 Tax=unclassified Peribacillus TaxID=2675266 RepID=UPI0036DC6C9A